MNYIWIFFISLSIIFSINKKSILLLTSINTSIYNSLLLCLQLACIYIFWCAILEIFESCGFGNILSKALKKPLHKIFPNLDDKTYSFISTSLACSLLGFGNVSVPSSIKAIESYNTKKANNASFSITLFALLNCINIQLFSTTSLSIYFLNGGTDVLLIWLIAIFISLFCIMLCYTLLKLYFKLRKIRKK